MAAYDLERSLGEAAERAGRSTEALCIHRCDNMGMALALVASHSHRHPAEIADWAVAHHVVDEHVQARQAEQHAHSKSCRAWLQLSANMSATHPAAWGSRVVPPLVFTACRTLPALQRVAQGSEGLMRLAFLAGVASCSSPAVAAWSKLGVFSQLLELEGGAPVSSC